MKKFIGIYIIKNKITNKFYVGHSIDINKRFNAHKSYLQRGIHHSIYLQRSWNKYGEHNFEFLILKLCKSESDSIKLEQFYIDNYRDYLYNTADSASFGGDLLSNNPNKEKIIKRRILAQKESLMKMSPEEKIDKFSRSGIKNGMYGKAHSKKTKSIISDINKGRAPINKGKNLEESVGTTRSKEIKQHLSNLAKNRTGDKNPFYGRHHSDETKVRLKNSMKGRKPINSRKVMINDIVYESLADAARNLNVVPATILYRIKSKNYPKYEYYDI